MKTQSTFGWNVTHFPDQQPASPLLLGNIRPSSAERGRDSEVEEQTEQTLTINFCIDAWCVPQAFCLTKFPIFWAVRDWNKSKPSAVNKIINKTTNRREIRGISIKTNEWISKKPRHEIWICGVLIYICFRSLGRYGYIKCSLSQCALGRTEGLKVSLLYVGHGRAAQAEPSQWPYPDREKDGGCFKASGHLH